MSFSTNGRYLVQFCSQEVKEAYKVPQGGLLSDAGEVYDTMHNPAGTVSRALDPRLYAIPTDGASNTSCIFVQVGSWSEGQRAPAAVLYVNSQIESTDASTCES